MAPSFDAVFLIAFGGPTSPEEIRPFLGRVLRDRPVAPERLEEVVRHYKAVGGRSPFNEITFRQASALEKNLQGSHFSLPVYVGLRHSRPFLRETLDRMTADGVKRALGFILASHQTEASWERYQKEVEEARSELGYAPAVDYCPGWHSHPLFIEAWADRLRAELEKILPVRRKTIPVVFTAHSVPIAMASRSPYVTQIEESCRLVAGRLGQERWSIAYQSRSGRPSEPWLEPDVGMALRTLASQGATEVVVAPIGFVSDHVEVLYDLDIEAKKIAEDLGVRLLRASCPNDHPTFIRMMVEVIKTKLSAVSHQPKSPKPTS